jgi:hypothetical protein
VQRARRGAPGLLEFEVPYRETRSDTIATASVGHSEGHTVSAGQPGPLQLPDNDVEIHAAPSTCLGATIYSGRGRPRCTSGQGPADVARDPHSSGGRRRGRTSPRMARSSRPPLAEGRRFSMVGRPRQDGAGRNADATPPDGAVATRSVRGPTRRPSLADSRFVSADRQCDAANVEEQDGVGRLLPRRRCKKPGATSCSRRHRREVPSR